MAKKKDEDILSNFMFGSPNVGKYKKIKETYDLYLKSINKFIPIFKNNPDCYLAIFNLDTKANIITELEKQYRDENLGSAYSQKASHVALDKMHGMFDLIKRKMYGYASKNDKSILPLIKSITTLNACLTNQCPIEALELAIVREYEKMLAKKEKDYVKYIEENEKEPEFKVLKKSETLVFYQDALKKLKSIDKETLDFLIEEVRLQFFDRLDNYKTPNVTFSPIPLDSRTCNVQTASKSSEFDYFLSMTVAKNKDEKNKRINIPFSTSGRCRKRLKMYKNCQPSIWIDKNNRVKISIPTKMPKVENKLKGKTTIIGVDLGINKIFSLGNGMKFGTFKDLLPFYKSECEIKLAGRSSLRNKMKEYQKELRKLNKKKGSCEKRKARLRYQISEIARKLQGRKRLQKSLNKYNNKVMANITKAINEFVLYLKSLKSKVLVVLENLDINSFNGGKLANQMSSMWSRAQIIEKLTTSLKREGFSVAFVDPAFTSQVCPVCYNINDKNRDKEQFECTCCGHKDDADNNAGVNITARYKDVEISEIVEKYDWNTYLKHEEIKKLYKKRNEEYLKRVK